MSEYVLADGSVSTEPSSEERTVVWTMGILLVISTVFFTGLHHLFPEVFDVPSNQGVAVPRYPGETFDVPYTGYGQMFVLDLIPIGLAFLCFYHGWKRLGLYRAMIFLGGSFVFTGLEESMWILLGRYQAELEALGGDQIQEAALGDAAAEVTGTYYFTRGFFWWLETPLLACLGWFFVAYSCVYVASILIPKAHIIVRAALGGFLAMDLDLWLDPVQTHRSWLSWIWYEGDPISIFGIPFSNFAGWFLLIFLFAIVFEYLPGMVKKWGVKKAAVIFYAIIVALEFGILMFFIIYGTIATKLLPGGLSITFWGI